jgi:hypothetical protein
VKRLFAARMKLGMFDPLNGEMGSNSYSVNDQPKMRLAAEMRESLSCLLNDRSALPLSEIFNHAESVLTPMMRRC